MNVYDFDGTLYDGDSSVDFYLFCLRRHPRLLFHVPYQLLGFLLYGLRRINKVKLKEMYFSFLRYLPDSRKEAEAFWNGRMNRIRSWYAGKHKVDDVVITASPKFLVAPACRGLHIRYLLATSVDPATGKFLGDNCQGKEKVRRFLKEFPDGRIDEFYSDSESDRPLAEIADRVFRVKKNGAVIGWIELRK